MIQEQAKRFLEDESNQQALRELIKIMHDIDRATGDYPKRDRERVIELSARRKSIDMVSAWITQVFAISRGEFNEEYEDREMNNLTNDY